jgi:hypothetical protein
MSRSVPCLFLPLFTTGLVSAQAAAVRVERMTSAESAAPLLRSHAPGVALMPAAAVAATNPPQLMAGWPKTLIGHPNFAPLRGVAFADLDRDGRHEILAASTNGSLYAWDVAGNSLPGFPRVLGIGFPQYTPAVGDLDGDGIPEIVQTTRGLTSGGRIYALRADGTDVPGWPVSLRNNNCEYTAALADLDFDGRLEVLVGERSFPNGLLHVLRADGTERPGWPQTLDHVPALSAGVADLDGDGTLEIVYGSYNSLYVFRADGTLFPGWPVNMSTRFGGNFSYQSPALADLDQDGDLEIVVACHQGGAGCYVFRHDGTLLPGWPRTIGTWTYSPPTVCDLEDDGRLDIVCGVAGGTASAPQVYAWDAGGVLKPGFPKIGPGGAEGPLMVADIDAAAPGKEIVFDSNLMDTATSQGWLTAMDRTGATLAGWPLRPTGFTYMNGSSLMDVDADGKPELATISHDSGTGVFVYLWKLDAVFSPARTDWWCYRESILRVGRFGRGHRNLEIGNAAVGAGFDVWLKSQSHGVGAMFLGFGAAAFHLPPLGVLQLDPTRPLLAVFAGALPAGEVATALLVPNDPLLRGGTLYFQGIEGSGVVDLSFTDMRSLRIR